MGPHMLWQHVGTNSEYPMRQCALDRSNIVQVIDGHDCKEAEEQLGARSRSRRVLPIVRGKICKGAEQQ